MRRRLLRYYHADGLGSTRLLTNESATPTDHYAYRAFGEIDPAASQQNSDNNFLFTGEQLDPDSGFYYLRARYMNYSDGRFTQSDVWAGIASSPPSLHKYVYANDMPSNARDPSGFATNMAGLGAAESVLGNLIKISNTGARVLRVYDKVNSIKELVIGVRSVIQYINASGPDWGSAYPGASNWSNLLPSGYDSIKFSEAADAFVRLAAKGVLEGMQNWTTGYVNTAASRGGRGAEAFLLYMPTFAPLPPNEVKPGAKFGGLPLNIVFGGPARKFGSLMGLGVRMKGRRQLLRMDNHSFDSGHGGATGLQAGELVVLKEAPYHMHVYSCMEGQMTNV